MALTKVNRGGLNTGIADSSNATAITISSSEIVTLADDLIIKDSGTIGSASKTDAITIAASGNTQLRSTGIAAGSQVFQIIDDGTTVLNVRSEDGNINFPVAGAGIFLGVTAAAASNLLDDYEEGTWTPDVANDGTSDNWNTRVGKYTKIGERVLLNFICDGGNSGTAGQQVKLTGLPFAVANGNAAIMIGAFLANGANNNNGGIISDGRLMNGGTGQTNQVSFITASLQYRTTA